MSSATFTIYCTFSTLQAKYQALARFFGTTPIILFRFIANLASCRKHYFGHFHPVRSKKYSTFTQLAIRVARAQSRCRACHIAFGLVTVTVTSSIFSSKSTISFRDTCLLCFSLEAAEILHELESHVHCENIRVNTVLFLTLSPLPTYNGQILTAL